MVLFSHSEYQTAAISRSGARIIISSMNGPILMIEKKSLAGSTYFHSLRPYAEYNGQSITGSAISEVSKRKRKALTLLSVKAFSL